VLNIFIGIGYIKEWWPRITRIIYIFPILHLPEGIQPKQSLAPPPDNTLHSPQLLWTTHRFSAAARNLLHLLSWQQTPTTSLNPLCNFFQKPQIFWSLLFNKQLLTQAADSKCFMETRITNKLIHHNGILCVLLSTYDSVYIDIPFF
jgi:hypothetical protein